MVTLGDAKYSIYQGLRSLPRRPYLVACAPLRIGAWTYVAWPW